MVGLITTYTLGGHAEPDRAKVFYEWSRVKLFDLALAVNTGDGGCGPTVQSDVCNRYGTYPELTTYVSASPLVPNHNEVLASKAAATGVSGCVRTPTGSTS